MFEFVSVTQERNSQMFYVDGSKYLVLLYCFVLRLRLFQALDFKLFPLSNTYNFSFQL